MASLGLPLLEAAVTALLVALGIRTAQESSRQTGKTRAEDASKSRDKPIAKTDAPAKVDKKCTECPPDKGILKARNVKSWKDINVVYQQRICQMPPAPAGFISEWFFIEEFDGFDSSQCLLKEAKSAYDQFFNEFGEFRYDFQRDIFEEMTKQGVRQYAVTQPLPPTKLRWYFMEPVSYRFMSSVFRAAAPGIEVVFQP
jgi:hypothetical protein